MIKMGLVKWQIFLRLLATGFTFAATYIIITSKQHVQIAGFTFYATWKYSSAFVFFGYANGVCCGLSALSILIVGVCCKSYNYGGNYFFMVIHDLMVASLLMAASAAATAVGYIGKYGNTHTGWTKTCVNFASFCSRVSVAIACSYAALFIYLLLTITSARKSNHYSF